MILAALSGLVAFAIDAGTKRLVVARLDEGRLYAGVGQWGLRVVHNQRGSFARLSTSVAVALWAALTTAVILLHPGAVAVAIGLGLVLGGGAANLVERARRGAVVDFVALGRWPVFNLADAAMVAGLALVIVGVR